MKNKQPPMSLEHIDLKATLSELYPYLDMSIINGNDESSISLHHGLKNELIFESTWIIVTDKKFFEHPIIKNFRYSVKGIFSVYNLDLDNLDYFPKSVDQAIALDNCRIKSLESNTLEKIKSFHVMNVSGLEDLIGICEIKGDILLSNLKDLKSLKGIEKNYLTGSLTIEKCKNLEVVDYLPQYVKLNFLLEDTLIHKISAKLIPIQGDILIKNNAFNEKELLRIFNHYKPELPEDFSQVVLSQNERKKRLIIKQHL